MPYSLCDNAVNLTDAWSDSQVTHPTASFARTFLEVMLRHVVRVLGLVGMLMAGTIAMSSASTEDSSQNCFGQDNERRISGCSELLEAPLLPNERSMALAMRALAYSIKGLYDLAIPDYDAAIEIAPNFAIALNNRAWAYFKSGETAQASIDVERALALTPQSPHALDTRAHIRQAGGNIAGALRDYEQAMQFGGTAVVRLYQCGLQAAGLYDGNLDGIISEKVRGALETCVRNSGCDPLPADEECRKLTS